jgi:sugar phosphate isomerase/epimerase
MKLGLSQACYRWVFYAHLRRDTPQYLDRGWPVPYFSAIPVAVAEEDAVDFLIERCIHYGLQALHLEAARLVDRPDARDKVRKMLDHGIEWISAAHANWVATGVEAERGYELYVTALRKSAALGATIVCTTHGAPNVHNHFTKNPPIERQIEIMAANFGRVAQVAADLGLVIAFENHLDYRASEVAAVIERVGSPALRTNFDTANPIGVIEDPVEAARRVARYAVMCHLKDFRVQAMTTIGLPQIHWAPVGRGSVDIDQILPILQESAPDPVNLRLCLEVAPLPEHDPDQWVAASVAHVRERYGRFLTS